MTKPELRDGEVLFAIRIDFEPGTEDAGRVFRAMSGLVDSFQRIDEDLTRSVSTAVQPVHVLHDIEAGSLTTWLRTILNQTNDDALLNLDWKPLIGQYLVRAKHRLLTWVNARDGIRDRNELDALESELLELAVISEVHQLPSYGSISRASLLFDLRDLSSAMLELRPEDRVTYLSPVGEIGVSASFRLSQDEIEDLLTAETHRGENDLVLLVKKPDYLGSSMWEFRLNGQIVHGRVLDQEWLIRFQSREVLIQPGDGLRARVAVEIKRAADGTTISERYHILRVFEVVAAGETVPESLFSDASDDTPRRPLSRDDAPPDGMRSEPEELDI